MGTTHVPMTCTPTEYQKNLQKQILEYRREGLSFPAIAFKLDMTQGYIYKLYKKALKAIIVEDVIEVRKMELERLDGLAQEITRTLKTFHPLVERGGIVYDTLEQDGKPVLDEEGNAIRVKMEDFGPRLAAVDRALRIMERRAKLLGLDAPTKVAATNPNGDKEACLVQFYLPANDRDEDSDLQTPE